MALSLSLSGTKVLALNVIVGMMPNIRYLARAGREG